MAKDSLSVLLIEDDDDHFEMLRRRITRASDDEIHLSRESSLLEGLQRIAETRFSVILLDLHLPDSSGIETCRRVVEHAQGTPVIVLSSMDMEEDGIRAVGERADDYIPKFKINGDLILRAVRCAVERGARREAEASLRVTQGELAAAREIQTSSLPDGVPQMATWDVAGKSIQADAVGGDYYDWIRLPDGDTLIAIGDASGHGLPAAFVMAQATASIRTAAAMTNDLAEIMRQCNELLLRDLPLTRFMTMAFLRLSDCRRSIQYCSAGHPPAFLFSERGALDRELRPMNIVLGLQEIQRFTLSPEIEIHPGDTIVLYTDGITESRSANRDLFGEERLKESIAQVVDHRPCDVIDHVFGSVQDFRAGEALFDDETIVVVRSVDLHY